MVATGWEDAYETLRVLGSVTYGMAFLVRSRVDGRPYCLKLMKLGRLQPKVR